MGSDPFDRVGRAFRRPGPVLGAEPPQLTEEGGALRPVAVEHQRDRRSVEHLPFLHRSAERIPTKRQPVPLAPGRHPASHKDQGFGRLGVAPNAGTGSFMWAIEWKEADAEKLPL